MITNQLKQQVLDRIKECKEIAKLRTGYDLGEIKVFFNLTGKTAGRANSDKMHLYINEKLLTKFPEDFMVNTIPHEISHLLADRIHNAYCRHDNRFKRILYNVYGIYPRTYHDYD